VCYCLFTYVLLLDITLLRESSYLTLPQFVFLSQARTRIQLVVVLLRSMIGVEMLWFVVIAYPTT